MSRTLINDTSETGEHFRTYLIIKPSVNIVLSPMTKVVSCVCTTTLASFLRYCRSIYRCALSKRECTLRTWECVEGCPKLAKLQVSRIQSDEKTFEWLKCWRVFSPARATTSWFEMMPSTETESLLPFSSFIFGKCESETACQLPRKYSSQICTGRIQTLF